MPSGTVTVRLFAAARAAAGTDAVVVPAAPLVDLLVGLRAQFPPRFAAVLAMSSLLSAGVRLDPGADILIPAGSVIDVLPPFAGG